MAKCIDKDLPVAANEKLQSFQVDNLFHKLIENSYSGISLLNKDLHIIYSSPAAKRIGGWNLSYHLENTLEDLIHPSDKQMVKEKLEKILSNPADSVTCIFRSKQAKGYYIWLECTFANMFHDADINAIVCNFRDVTQQKKAEEQLQQTIKKLLAYKYALDESAIIANTDHKGIIKQEYHSKLLESVITYTTDAVIITEANPLDAPGPCIIYVNKAFTTMTGYLPEEVIGKTPRILQGPKSDVNELTRLGKAMRNFEVCEITTINYKKSGEEFWINFSVSPVANDEGEYTHFISIEKDVTQQKNEALQKAQLSEAVTASLKERNIILESIADAFFAVDKNWTVTYWNKVAENILSKTKEEVLDRNLWEIFSESINSKSYLKYHQAIKKQQVVHFQDYYEPLNKWYEITAYPSGTGLSVYFKDITDRKLSEIMLITSKKKYSELFNLSPLPMWVIDQNSFEFLDVNAAAVKKYGFTREEFLSMSMMDITPKEDIGILKNITKTKKHALNHGISRHQKKNGEIIQVDILTNTLSYREKNAKVVIANDVTQRLNYIKAIEDQNEKLREISWIQSHIVRAPLCRIMGLVPLIINGKEVSDDTETMLRYLLASANELDDLIKTITDKTTKADFKVDDK